MIFPKSVKIVEVSPRDGLQNESLILSTIDKVKLIRSIIDSGISNIELTSFVHPKVIPQLADAELLLKKVPWYNNLHYSALVPNLKGFERAQNTKLKNVTVFISASESHNQNNVNFSILESLKILNNVCSKAILKGFKIRGEIAVSFGCPFEGKIPKKRVLYISKKLCEMGCSEIVLADTIGIANPRQVYDMFSSIRNEIAKIPIAAHFHDTNGVAFANIIAAIQANIRIFDSSIGGLGGCPFAPGAKGNISTESLVYLMNKMNIKTGINIKKLMESIKLLEKLLNKKIQLIPEIKKIKNK